MWFDKNGDDVIIWSGGGWEYAEQFQNEHRLPGRVITKAAEFVDVAFDDATDNINGAKVTIKVPANKYPDHV